MKTIAIIGRPNVGKSTLFNRLAGKKLAIVDDTPGVTRDRRYAPGSLADLDFTLIDTAGMEEGAKDALETRMLEQTKAAIKEADILLLVIDARVGVTGADEHFAELVRRAGKPTLLLLNKSEGKAGADTLYDAYALGFGDPVRLSAEHGEGFGDFFEALLPLMGEEAQAPKEEQPKKSRLRKVLPQTEEEHDALLAEETQEDASAPLSIAIVGRPNAGKSTLINALLHEERLLTGPEAGITRDAIAVDYEYKGKPIKLVDTAGMRKKANVTGKLEFLSVGDSLRSIQYAHVAVVVMDATIPLERQDAAIAALVEREGRACVLALSKWDLVRERIVAGLEGQAPHTYPSSASEQRGREAGRRSASREVKNALHEAEKAYLEEIRYQCSIQLPQMKDVTLVPLSAMKGNGLEKLMDACFETYDIWNKRISTAQLNRWLEGALDMHTPPLVKGRRLKVKYMTQIKTRPPTFQLHTNIADAFPDAYLRYLTNGLRETFALPGVPLRIVLKSGENPFAPKKRKKSS